MILTFGTDDLSRHTFVRWMRAVCAMPAGPASAFEGTIVRSTFLSLRNEFSIYLPDERSSVLRTVLDIRRMLASTLRRLFPMGSAPAGITGQEATPRWTVALPRALFDDAPHEAFALQAIGAVRTASAHPLFAVGHSSYALTRLIDALASWLDAPIALPNHTVRCTYAHYAAEAGHHCDVGPLGEVAILRPSSVEGVDAFMRHVRCAHVSAFSTSDEQMDALYARLSPGEDTQPALRVLRLRRDLQHISLRRAHTVFVPHAGDVIRRTALDLASPLLNDVSPSRVLLSTLHIQHDETVHSGASMNHMREAQAAHVDRDPTWEELHAVAARYGYRLRPLACGMNDGKLGLTPLCELVRL